MANKTYTRHFILLGSCGFIVRDKINGSGVVLTDDIDAIEEYWTEEIGDNMIVINSYVTEDE